MAVVDEQVSADERRDYSIAPGMSLYTLSLGISLDGIQEG